MNYNDNPKPTLFISYCWDDGSVYADELEAQLVDYFEVKRDIRTKRIFKSVHKQNFEKATR